MLSKTDKQTDGRKTLKKKITATTCLNRRLNVWHIFFTLDKSS